VLGPLFFSIGAAHILEALAALPASAVWAYLNDILIAIHAGITESAVKAAITAAFATAEREGAIVGLILNWAKSAVWAPANTNAEDLIPQAVAADGCAVVTQGLKILSAPVGTTAFVQESLRGIVARATTTLNQVFAADLPLQHKFVLLRQCVSQIPTFWAQAVLGANTTLAVWDTALIGRAASLVGMDITDSSIQASITHLPVHLGGLGLRAMQDTAPHTFVTSVLFAAALARKRGHEFVCSNVTAQRIRALLPELRAVDACSDVKAWR
jgi:hypothetical protein